MHANNVWTFTDIQKHCKSKADMLSTEKSTLEADVVESKKYKVTWLKKRCKGKWNGHAVKATSPSALAKKRKKVLTKLKWNYINTTNGLTMKENALNHMYIALNLATLLMWLALLY